MSTYDPTPYAPNVGPCVDWCEIEDVRNRCEGIDAAELDDPAITFGIKMATTVLWSRTARQFGICRHTARPCHAATHQWAFASQRGGHYDDMNQHIHHYQGGGCGCRLPELELPGPIAAVESIVYDGVTLDPASYAVKTAGHRARQVVLRLDADSSGNPVEWWTGNDLLRDPTQAVAEVDEDSPAWQVTWHRGLPVPPEGVEFAALLAEQFARAKCGGPCTEKVSAPLTRVARRGSTREFAKVSKEETGNPLVDEWIRSVNPFGRVRRSRVVRADNVKPRQLWAWIETPEVVVP